MITIAKKALQRSVDKQPTEEIVKPTNVETMSTSTRRNAPNLPPADILFDHIDRVSTKIDRVKTTFKVDEESALNTSTISKGSFRNRDRAPAFRKASLELMSECSDDEYVEGIDDPKKKHSQKLAKAASVEKNFVSMFQLQQRQHSGSSEEFYRNNTGASSFKSPKRHEQD